MAAKLKMKYLFVLFMFLSLKCIAIQPEVKLVTHQKENYKPTQNKKHDKSIRKSSLKKLLSKPDKIACIFIIAGILSLVFLITGIVYLTMGSLFVNKAIIFLIGSIVAGILSHFALKFLIVYSSTRVL